MYIKEIELEKFKGFKYVKIPFDNGLTVITGPKGSGKGSILDSINFIRGISENDLVFFNSDSLKIKVKIVFNNDNTIEKILEKDLSNNIRTLYYLNEQVVSKEEFSKILKDLNLTIIDNCGSELSKRDCAKYAKDLKAKSKQEQIIVISYEEEILAAADRILAVHDNKVMGIKL